MKKILFINSKKEKCGVYQYGIHVYEAFKKIKNFSFIYTECSNTYEIKENIINYQPDLILYNYHEGTLSFVDKKFLKEIQGPIHVCLAHELLQSEIDKMDDSFFQYYMFADPVFIESNPRVFKLNRLLFPYTNIFSLPKIPTIGTYGFASRVKGYHDILKLIEKEFDEAVLRINIAPHTPADPDGKMARELAVSLAKSVKKPGIKLAITHHFFSDSELLDFLAQNTLNVFMYDPFEISAMRGAISSAVDQAISVGRPIAITKNPLLRHLRSIQPSIIVKYFNSKVLLRFIRGYIKNILKPAQVILKYKSLSLFRIYLFNCYKQAFEIPKILLDYRNSDYNSLKNIIQNGTQPLEHLYEEWSEQNFQKNFHGILSKIFTHAGANAQNPTYETVLDRNKDQSSDKVVAERR